MPVGPLCMVPDRSCAAEPEPSPFNLPYLPTQHRRWRLGERHGLSGGNEVTPQGDVTVCTTLVVLAN